jgi:CHAT domain-containing protein
MRRIDELYLRTPFFGSRRMAKRLTLLGCRRVTSAMWELADHASAEFARHWLTSLQQHVFRPEPRSPHAFAMALREALIAFRQANGGRFDHVFFWAPYTLYGLG